MQKILKTTETLAHVFSSESIQRELSNEYQHDMDSMVFKNLCILVLWSKIASALEGLSDCGPRTDSTSVQALRYNQYTPYSSENVINILLVTGPT